MDGYKIEEPRSSDTPKVGMPRDLGDEPHLGMAREAVRESLAEKTPPGTYDK